jgi:hypothetical protein
MRVLLVAYDRLRNICGLRCEIHSAPSVVQTDYPALQKDAERQRARMITLD